MDKPIVFLSERILARKDFGEAIRFRKFDKYRISNFLLLESTPPKQTKLFRKCFPEILDDRILKFKKGSFDFIGACICCDIKLGENIITRKQAEHLIKNHIPCILVSPKIANCEFLEYKNGNGFSLKCRKGKCENYKYVAICSKNKRKYNCDGLEELRKNFRCIRGEIDRLPVFNLSTAINILKFKDRMIKPFIKSLKENYETIIAQHNEKNENLTKHLEKFSRLSAIAVEYNKEIRAQENE